MRMIGGRWSLSRDRYSHRSTRSLNRSSAFTMSSESNRGLKAFTCASSFRRRWRNRSRCPNFAGRVDRRRHGLMELLLYGVAGRVAGGFAVKLFSSIEFYGLCKDEMVQVLAIQNTLMNNAARRTWLRYEISVAAMNWFCWTGADACRWIPRRKSLKGFFEVMSMAGPGDSGTTWVAGVCLKSPKKL